MVFIINISLPYSLIYTRVGVSSILAQRVFAGGKSVELESVEHTMVLKKELITEEVQHDLDELGIAKTAREEKQRARAEKLKEAKENERMARLYREHILKEPAKPKAPLVQIQLGMKKKPQEEITPAGFGD